MVMKVLVGTAGIWRQQQLQHYMCTACWHIWACAGLVPSHWSVEPTAKGHSPGGNEWHVIDSQKPAGPVAGMTPATSWMQNAVTLPGMELKCC